MVDGVSIYDYLTQDQSSKFLVCRDVLVGGRFEGRPDIHGDGKHIPVEFAGALTAVVFYVSHSEYLTIAIAIATCKC